MKKVQQMIKLEPMIKLEDPFTVEEAKALVLDRPNFVKADLLSVTRTISTVS